MPRSVDPIQSWLLGQTLTFAAIQPVRPHSSPLVITIRARRACYAELREWPMSLVSHFGRS